MFWRKVLGGVGDLRAAGRLERSGLFDSASYQKCNPDVPTEAKQALVHFVRFGRREIRNDNQSPLARWLMDPVLSGRVPVDVVRKLKAEDKGVLQEVAREYSLDFTDYLFHWHYHSHAFEEALEVLQDREDPASFEHLYLLTVRRMGSANLQDVSEKILLRLEDCPNWTLEQLRCAREMMAATGYENTEETALNRRVLDVFARLAPTSPEACWAALWRLGFGIMPDSLGVSDRVMGMLPERLQRKLAALDFALPDAVKSWTELISVATFNALAEPNNRLALRKRESWELVPVDQLPVFDLRLLSQSYWEQAAADKNQAMFVSGFKSVTTALLERAFAVCPRLGSGIFDLRRDQYHGALRISYHTVTGADQATINFKESALPGFFRFDSAGFSGWSQRVKIDEHVADDEIDRFFQNLHDRFVTARESKYEQPVRADEKDLPSDFAFISLQVPDDTVTVLESMPRDVWVRTALRQLEVSEVEAVIKVHPFDRSENTKNWLKALQTDFPSLIVSRAPIHDLLERAQFVLTVNSGVGMEALLHLKPVICCGASDYAEVAETVTSPVALKSAIDKFSTASPRDDWPSNVKRFLYAYFHENCFELDRVPLRFYELLDETLA